MNQQRPLILLCNKKAGKDFPHLITKKTGMKNMTFNFKFLQILLCFLFLLPFVNVQSRPVVATTVDTPHITYQKSQKTKKEIKAGNKLKRKFQRLKTKIEKFTKKSNENKKANITLILGLILLVVGIVVTAAAFSTGTGLSALISFFFLFVIGVALGISGLVTLLIGAIQSF